MDTYSLICEGVCNPAIGIVDSLVADEAVLVMRRPPHPETWSRDLFVAQRRLAYTTHTPTAVDHVKCVDCGHARRFGNSL